MPQANGRMTGGNTQRFASHGIYLFIFRKTASCRLPALGAMGGGPCLLTILSTSNGTSRSRI